MATGDAVAVNPSTGDLTYDSDVMNSGGSVSLAPAATGGLSTFHLVSAGSTNATNIKATPGQVYGYEITNTNAAARKVAFHNTAGTPTAGAAVVWAVHVPASGHVSLAVPAGIAFATGIAITAVTGAADSDNTAVAANDLIINVFYK